jgi:hypothetical protein
MDKPEYIICPKCKAEIQYSEYFQSYSCLTMFCDWANFDPPGEYVKYCMECGMNTWCWNKNTGKDCPTAREILDWAGL